MYRVLLRIQKVTLRVREPVQLRILIRKDHRFLTYTRNQVLADGEALLTNSVEFLLDAKSPKFDIEVQLISGEARKLGGVVPINLKSLKIGVTHQRQKAIKKTPLQHSSMTLKITYMRSEYRLKESLISMDKLQGMIGSSKINGNINEHEKLVFRNNSLTDQVQQLKQANQALQKQHRNLQDSMKEKSEKFREEMELIEQTRMQASGSERERKRLAQMVQDIQKNNQKQGKREKRRGGVTSRRVTRSTTT